jgi:phenylpropionate dioxygenase-like ring-hydroxylating dioxygenase large terminal subunit
MAVFDHWHPILCSHKLRKCPVAVRLHGRDLVLFRGDDGQIGALEDCCPHRRMRLSLGKVAGGRLQCPYHGWTFDCSGAGESPGTPKLHACAARFDAVEKHGAVWVKPFHARPVFPAFDVNGYFQVGTLLHRVKAPLELVLDNFTEIEHTPTTHAFFGYSLERMNEVEVRFEPTEETVRVINRGPPRRMSLLWRLLLGIGRGYEFHDEWTTHFSPVHSVYDHWWANPHSGRENLVRWRLYIFFTPLDQEETSIITFAYTKSRYPGPAGCARLFKWLMLGVLDREIRLDVAMLENLADTNPNVEGLKLSRFDRVLGLNRERMQKIYRGKPGKPSMVISTRLGRLAQVPPTNCSTPAGLPGR